MEQPIHIALGLTDDEYASITELLGREPNHLELAMYAVMWSEHCSYKSSRVHLKRLPTEAPWVLVGPGENAGVVDVGEHRSFVMADIPGLIEGAADGAGLGHRFLKHLDRTGVLLHLIDIAPPDPDSDPVKDARAIIAELKKYSKTLAAKPRWLVLNKSDLLLPEEAKAVATDIARRLRHKGQKFLISGATGEGTKPLCDAIMQALEAARKPQE
jgi:GTPase involved in cell partitioning and DNA repair